MNNQSINIIIIITTTTTTTTNNNNKKKTQLESILGVFQPVSDSNESLVLLAKEL